MPGLAVDRRFLDQPAYHQDEQCRQQAEHEQRAPGLLRRQQAEHQRVEDGGEAPADGPAGLHQADRLAAVAGLDHFADEYRAGGPFATEAEAHQGPRDQQLLVVLREAAEEGEEGEPEHRQLQGQHPADAVGEDPGDPAAGGGGEQGHGVDEAGFAGADPPQGDQGGDHEAQHLGVHAVQAVADLAAPEGPAFLLVEGAIPAEMTVPGSVRAGVEGHVFFHGGTDRRYWCYEDSVGAVAPGGCILRGWPASVQLIYAAAGDKKFRWRSRPSCVDHVPPESGRWHGSCSLLPPCVPCPSVPAT